VDLKTARERGIPVFNAPFSNTRSVAEMVIAEMIMLARELGTRNNEMHAGIWNKRSEGCFEVRGKTLGIIGYGNIGTQVSTLAESLGMKVIFYDVVSKLSLGNAKPVATLQDLLKKSDFVTLHVPMTESTQGMIGANELALMKEGAYLLNASRGTVVQMEPLVARLKSGYLSGAALDVFPVEPEKTKGEFKTELAGLNNVIMTPHIGGATEEAQGNIGREVSSTLVKFYETGSTFMSVNMPQVDVPKASSKMVGSRFTNIHKNVPGVLRELNRIVSECGANILSQHLATDPQLGYLIMDLDQPLTDQMLVEIQKVSASIQSRRI
jgi:D-3-phosphoglycerate dehydrogenase